LNLKYYLQLARPANIITAIADILAGVAIATFSFSIVDIEPSKVFFLCLSTIGLYGGGIVFNDIFDFEIDKLERPERIIPSGKVSKNQATKYGILLLSFGIIAAFLCSVVSFFIAIGVAVCALIYNKYGKHHSFLGPINMGLCRGGNLILGMSILEAALRQWWYLGLFPVFYIAAITMISRDEVHGGKKKTLYFAAFLYLLVSTFQLMVSYSLDNLLLASGFVFLHIYLIIKPLLVAIAQPTGLHIGKAVKAGVLSLIVMDAAWVAVSGNVWLALLVLLLLPISIRLAKYFAVT
jgi:4-hydroxybenzoate polyprenyltransferase